MVELMLEGDAVVGRLEQTAGGGGDPVDARVGLVDREGGDASAHVRRADAAPRQRLEPVRRQRRGPVGFGGASEKKREKAQHKGGHEQMR